MWDKLLRRSTEKTYQAEILKFPSICTWKHHFRNVEAPFDTVQRRYSALIGFSFSRELLILCLQLFFERLFSSIKLIQLIYVDIQRHILVLDNLFPWAGSLGFIFSFGSFLHNAVLSVQQGMPQSTLLWWSGDSRCSGGLSRSIDATQVVKITGRGCGYGKLTGGVNEFFNVDRAMISGGSCGVGGGRRRSRGSWERILHQQLFGLGWMLVGFSAERGMVHHGGQTWFFRFDIRISKQRGIHPPESGCSGSSLYSRRRGGGLVVLILVHFRPRLGGHSARSHQVLPGRRQGLMSQGLIPLPERGSLWCTPDSSCGVLWGVNRLDAFTFRPDTSLPVVRVSWGEFLLSFRDGVQYHWKETNHMMKRTANRSLWVIADLVTQDPWDQVGREGGWWVSGRRVRPLDCWVWCCPSDQSHRCPWWLEWQVAS